jgi:hypothetical protein
LANTNSQLKGFLTVASWEVEPEPSLARPPTMRILASDLAPYFVCHLGRLLLVIIEDVQIFLNLLKAQRRT